MDIVARCRNRAAALIEVGRVADGLAVIEHALGHAPDDRELLADYVAIARRAAVAAGSPEAVAERMWMLVAYLRARIAHVGFDTIEPILGWIETIERELAAEAEDDGEEERDLTEAERVAQVWDHTEATFREGLASVEAAPSVLQPYLLQGLENLLRPFATAPLSLEGARAASLCEALEALRAASDRAAAAVREHEARARWKAFAEAHASKVSEIEKWVAPSVAEPGGRCQRILDAIRDLAMALQPVVVALGDASVARDANDLAQRLQRKAAIAMVAQQNLFDRHVLAKLGAGFDACFKHVGIIDDEKALGDAMIEHFGSIDPRQLGPEAQRAYSEMFEVLFRALDKVSKGEDVSKRGTKLYVLDGLLKATTRSASEF